MPFTKPIFLEVRPFQVAHLCFEVGGILGESFTELGATVFAFNFGGLYQAFRAANPSKAVDPGHPGRLEFDSDAINVRTKVPVVIKNVPRRPFALAALRAEPLRAALDKAINARANAFITKYAIAEPIISNMKETARIKGELLPRLSDGMTLQTQLLFNAYEKDGLIGDGTVVKHVTNVTRSTGNTQSSASVVDTHTTSTDSKADGTKVATSIIDSKATPTVGGETTSVSGSTETRLIDFKAPSLECLARNERAQISLRDEQFANFLQTLHLERFEEIFKNELASIDADVNQMQVAYLNTILMSPIDGIVTGVYKNPGDSVSAGEPVFRVENDAVVLIVAKVVCRGAVLIGSSLSIKTTLFDADGSPSTVFINATIVAARGQGDDDLWEVIGKVSNIDAKGKRILPLGYHFDNDITEVSITGPNEI